MRRFRATDYVRMILATTVLVGSVGSTPIFGHAHERPEADDHDHLDWVAHAHSHGHLEADFGAEQYASVESNDAVFHLHGMWFGILFTLPSPTEGEDERAAENPLALTCLTPVVTFVAGHCGSVWRWVVCFDLCGLAPNLCVVLEPPITPPHGMQPRSPLGGHCALEARSGVLRC